VLFDSYAVDRSKQATGPQNIKYSTRERYLWELYKPVPGDPRFAGLDPQLVDRLKKEFYRRLDSLRRRETAAHYSANTRKIVADLFPMAPAAHEIKDLHSYAEAFAERGPVTIPMPVRIVGSHLFRGGCATVPGRSPAITQRPGRRVLAEVAQYVGELKGQSGILRAPLRLRSAKAPDMDAGQTDRRCDAVAVQAQARESRVGNRLQVHFNPIQHRFQVYRWDLVPHDCIVQGRQGDMAIIAIQGLSERRARTVAAELVRDGVPQNAISMHAYGDTKLLVPTGPGVREPQNRRVEIVFH